VATDTIREFLVSLGFVTDEPALKRFTTGIDKATKAVFSLAAAIEGTAVLVAAGVARFASNLEALYFAAQRTGSSATSLKALDLAARNLGANAGEAEAAIEGLASALRTNPGNIGLLTGLLARLGYTLKVNADGSIDSADALLKLTRVFKGMPYFQAKQFADQLGISEHTLYQLTRGNLLQEYQKALKELGPDWDQASRHAHDFMVDLRAFRGELEKFGLQVVDAIQQKLGFSLKDLRHWFEVNGPWLAQRVADVAKQMIDAAQWIADKVGYLVDKLKEWDTETDGVSTKLIALAVLLKVTGAGSIIGGVLSLAGAFVRLAAAMAGVNAAGATGAMARILGPVGVGVATGWALDKYFPNNWLAKAGGALGNWLYDSSGAHRKEEALRFFRDRWGANQAAGIVANLIGESGLDPGRRQAGGGPGYGLAQWEGPRQADFRRLFGHDIHGSSALEQMEFVDWELRNHPEYGAAMLRAAQNSDAAARVFSQYYERPAGGAAEADRRAGIAAHITQQNTFHIATNDPRAAAASVDNRLKQINADLTRSFAALTQ
jgi:hypothetical protein